MSWPALSFIFVLYQLHFHTDSIVIQVLNLMKLTKHITFQESQVLT